MNLGFMSFLFIDIHRKLHECNPAHEELCFHEADDKGRTPKELPLVVCPVKKDAKPHKSLVPTSCQVGCFVSEFRNEKYQSGGLEPTAVYMGRIPTRFTEV